MYISPRFVRLVAITATVATTISMTAACASGDEAQEEDAEDEFIGAPPEDDDDPLFEHALPAEAVPADPTGRVGEPDEPPADEDPEPEKPATDQQVSMLENEVARLEDEIARLESQVDEPDDEVARLEQQVDDLESRLEQRDAQLQQQDAQLRQKEEQLEEHADAETPEAIPDEREACFSCVQICPIGDGDETNCPDGADDLICGWGSHEEDPDQARQVAQAQCESSLEMARQMPSYAGIEGNCPPATCR